MSQLNHSFLLIPRTSCIATIGAIGISKGADLSLGKQPLALEVPLVSKGGCLKTATWKIEKFLPRRNRKRYKILKEGSSPSIIESTSG